MPAGIVMGAAAIGSAVISSDASRKATRAQQQAGQQAIDAQLGMQKRAEDLTKPQREFGFAAQAKLGKLFGIPNRQNFNASAYLNANPDVAASGMDPFDHYTQYGKNEGRQGFGLESGKPDYSDFENSPGFNFAKMIGSQAINRNATAQGNLYSPTTMNKLSEYNTGFASQHYNDYVKQLIDMSGMGTAGTQTAASGAIQTGEGVSNSFTNVGQSNASGVANQAGAWQSLLNNPAFTGMLKSAFGGGNAGAGMADMSSRPNIITGVAGPMSVPGR